MSKISIKNIKTAYLIYSVNDFIDAAVVDFVCMILLIWVSFAATYYFGFWLWKMSQTLEYSAFLQFIMQINFVLYWILLIGWKRKNTENVICWRCKMQVLIDIRSKKFFAIVEESKEFHCKENLKFYQLKKKKKTITWPPLLT